MHLGDDHPTYYDLLELTAGASPQEIRSAYLRLKAAYSKDSVALYSLIDKEEMSQMSNRIEEAYLILSHPDKRRAYDQAQGLIPPIEDDPFRYEPQTPAFASSGFSNSGGVSASTVSATPISAGPFAAPATAAPSTFAPATPTYNAPVAQVVRPVVDALGVSASAAGIDDEIAAQTEWAGAFVKRVREARRITLEELCDFTRISKIYLKSIEDEDYGKLPASVYLRGFLIQISKRLKIPQEPFVTQYLHRFKTARPDKA